MPLSAEGPACMSTIERVLSVGSTESPDCRCGSEMSLASVQASMDDSDTALRIYVCPACLTDLTFEVQPVRVRGPPQMLHLHQPHPHAATRAQRVHTG